MYVKLYKTKSYCIISLCRLMLQLAINNKVIHHEASFKRVLWYMPLIQSPIVLVRNASHQITSFGSVDSSNQKKSLDPEMRRDSCSFRIFRTYHPVTVRVFRCFLKVSQCFRLQFFRSVYSLVEYDLVLLQLLVIINERFDNDTLSSVSVIRIARRRNVDKYCAPEMGIRWIRSSCETHRQLKEKIHKSRQRSVKLRASLTRVKDFSSTLRTCVRWT